MSSFVLLSDFEVSEENVLCATPQLQNAEIGPYDPELIKNLDPCQGGGKSGFLKSAFFCVRVCFKLENNIFSVKRNLVSWKSV